MPRNGLIRPDQHGCNIRGRLIASTRDRLARRRHDALADADIWRLSPAFWGKDEQGRPRTGHQHAFFLPADEDRDGRLDHVTIFAPMGLNHLEQQAIDRLRRLPLADREPLQLLLIGLGQAQDFRAPLVEESAVWTSATPFLATRMPKRRGRKKDRPENYEISGDYPIHVRFAGHVLREELERLRQRLPHWPAVQTIEPLESGIGAHRLRAIQFKRFRRKSSDDGGRRPSGGFRITFAKPVAGPLCLGHSCHFGLGLFMPDSRP